MKKKVLLIGIISWTAVAALLIAIIVNAAYGGGFGIMNYNSVLVKEDAVSIAGISNITVQSDLAGIEVLSTEESQIRVRQYGANLGSKELFTVELNGPTAKIELKHKFRFFNIGFGFLSERLVIEVPSAWIGDVNVYSSSGGIRLNDTFTWENVKFSCSSGGINIDKPLSAGNLDINVSSGGIHVNDVLTVAEQLTVDSSSGGIHLNAPIKAGKINAKVSSGGMTLGEVNVSEFNLVSSSGGIKVEGITGSGSAKASSGGIKIKLNDPLGDVKLTSSSGQIKIAVDKALSFNFDGKCTSGSIHADFPLNENKNNDTATATVGNNPTASITANSTSGGILVNLE